MERAQRNELQRLMVRLASGDRLAFDPVFELLWPVLRGFAARALGAQHGAHADSEDVAQLALMKVFAHASKLDPERDALTWVIGIAAYECRTARKKSLRRREAPLLTTHEPISANDPESETLERDLERAALDVLGSLSVQDVQTLRAMMHGMTHGMSQDVPPATFRKRVERAVARLRMKWSSRHGLD